MPTWRSSSRTPFPPEVLLPPPQNSPHEKFWAAYYDKSSVSAACPAMLRVRANQPLTLAQMQDRRLLPHSHPPCVHKHFHLTVEMTIPTLLSWKQMRQNQLLQNLFLKLASLRTEVHNFWCFLANPGNDLQWMGKSWFISLLLKYFNSLFSPPKILLRNLWYISIQHYL